MCRVELAHRVLHINPTSFQDQSTTPSRCDSLITLIFGKANSRAWLGHTESEGVDAHLWYCSIMGSRSRGGRVVHALRYLDAVVSVWVSSGYEPKDAAMRGGGPQHTQPP